MWEGIGDLIMGSVNHAAALPPPGVVDVVSALAGVWTLLVGAVLVVVAVILNLAGVENVYATLYSRLVGGSAGADDANWERIREVDHAEITDARGRFSPRQFEAVTGLTPPEFIHLYITANGGRVQQTTINARLPWSKSSVTRYLHALESEGKVVRVETGGRNVVCTPEEAPVGERDG